MFKKYFLKTNENLDIELVIWILFENKSRNEYYEKIDRKQQFLD
jgi:hypothetical protein